MRTHPVDPFELSAYRDGALDETRRPVVEAHLRVCAACRRRVAEYVWLGSALSASAAVQVPASVDRQVLRMARREQAKRPPFFLFSSSFRPAWAAVLLVGLLSAALFAGLPLGGDRSGPMVAAAYIYDDQGSAAIEVRFSEAVDRASVQQSLHIDPPVPVAVTWRGDNTMVVKASQPLPSAKQFTLELKPKGAESRTTPVALQFTGTVPATPMPLTTRTPALAAPPPTATPGRATTSFAAPVAPTPSMPAPAQATAGSRVAVAPVTATPGTGTVSATSGTAPPGSSQLVRGFGLLYRSHVDVATQLGRAMESEHGAELSVQSFKGGLMISRGDRKEIIALLDGGRWLSFPDRFEGAETTPPQSNEPVRGFGKVWRENPGVRATLGSTTSTERTVAGSVQQFERGAMVATADRTIYVLYASGMWAQYYDSYLEETATPTPAPTRGLPTVTATATATATPVAPTVTRTPAPATSTATPTLQASPTLTATAATKSSATPTPRPTVRPGETPVATPTLTATGTVTFVATQEVVEVTGTPPPTEMTATLSPAATPGAELTATPTLSPGAPPVVHGFGMVYDEGFSVAERLGEARGEEMPVQMVRQSFEQGGMVLRADTRQIVVVRRDGSWSLYRDTWQEGEPLAVTGSAPPNRTAPVQEFGKLWRQQPEVRSALGWALAPERTTSGLVQQFSHGTMLGVDYRLIYVLYEDGSWQSFADTYIPTATPSPTLSSRLP